MSYRFEPHDPLTADLRPDRDRAVQCGEGGVPGVVGMWVGTGEGYTGTQPPNIPGPIFNHILKIDPTHGQMKAFFMILMRFPR